jgi:hypothetical protein
VSNVNNRFTLVALILVLGAVVWGAKPPDEWLTLYEKSNYLETPRYDETVAYCKRLAEFSPLVSFTDFGVSPQGRKLPLLIIDKDREFDPRAAHARGKVVLLVQAGIHAGEIEGKDAGLTLIRDIIVKNKYPQLLDHVVLLFIPIFNVDGHERFGPYNRINQDGPREMGWRTTAQNLNLNRDFAKADSPEMRSWLGLFDRWLPDFLIDVHTTDGADFQYVVTCGLETNRNVVKPLAEWCDSTLMPELEKRMAESGFPVGPYVYPRVDHAVTSGLMSWTATPRFSNGYGAAQNRPFMLVETHMLKSYRQRVESTYELLRNVLEYLNSKSGIYTRLILQGDSLTAAMAGSYYPISFRPSRDSVMLDFLGVDFRFEHSVISDTSAVVWGNKKVTYRVPYFDRNAVADSVLVPYAYVIPSEWRAELEILKLHGARIDFLSRDTELSVDSYRFGEPKWSVEPFEGRHALRVKTTPITEKRNYPAGTAVVIMNQRTNRIVTHLLEPRSGDSFVAWGFFDAIMEQKEYAENYVIEKMAPAMLAKDPALKLEFENRLVSDTAFAKNPEARLQFFYERSLYWDRQLNVYPIGKLVTRVDLPLK